MFSKKDLFLILAFFMFVNILLSIYIYEAKAFNDNALTLGTDECFAGSEGGCFIVQTSEYATTLGVPNPVYGLVFFGLLFITFLIFAFVRNISKYLKVVFLSFTSLSMIVGSIFSIWLLHVQFTLIHTTCIYCLWVDGLMLLSTWLFFFLYGHNLKKELFVD